MLLCRAQGSPCSKACPSILWLPQDLPCLRHPVWWAHRIRLSLRPLLALTFYEWCKTAPSQGNLHVKQRQSKRKTHVISQGSESLEMGISGVHMSGMDTGNGERNISRAEMSEAQCLVVLHKRSIILGEAESSGLVSQLPKLWGVLEDYLGYDSSICYRNREVVNPVTLDAVGN